VLLPESFVQCERFEALNRRLSVGVSGI
jgi:hypothetical protein